MRLGSQRIIFSLFLGLLLWTMSGPCAVSSARAADPDDSEVIDVKPHYAPLSLVEVFITADCPRCLKTLKTLNQVESSTGNRRGQAIFLSYVLARNPTEERAFDQTGSRSRDQIQKRWNIYADLFKMRVIALPELIANGKKIFSTTKPEVLEKLIDRALLEPSKVALSLQLGTVSREGIRVKYSVDGLPKARRDDLYLLTVTAVKPRTPVPVYTLDGVDTDQLYANLVEAIEIIRIEGDDSGEVELHIPEQVLPAVRELAGIVQDARTGKPIAGETVRIKLPSPNR